MLKGATVSVDGKICTYLPDFNEGFTKANHWGKF